MAELRRDEEEWLRRFWEEKRPTRMTFIELRNLYIHTKNRAKELGIPDPETTAKELIDRVFDPSLTYAENLGLVDAELIKLGVPTELPKELEELEYWKKRAEELEKELKKKPMPRVTAELRKLRERIDRLEKMIKERTITREEYERLRLAVSEAFKKLIAQLREFMRAVPPAPTVPTVPTVPTIPFKPIIGAPPISAYEVFLKDIEFAEDRITAYPLSTEERDNLMRILEEFRRIGDELSRLEYGIRAQRERLNLRDKARSLLDRVKLYIDYDIRAHLSRIYRGKELEDALRNLKKPFELLWSDIARL